MSAVAALALTGCSANAGGSSNADAQGEIVIGEFAGWGESIVTSALWKIVLEEEGYDVKIESANVSPVFIGVSDGTYDFATQMALPVIHKAFIDEYGDSMVDLGAWYDTVQITLAVNEDAPIDSIEELAANADLFGDQIVGIEPGAGQTILMEDVVIPGYGLDDMEFTASSTAGMLASLAGATTSGENIVVSLWEPHWAYLEFPIKNLEDPQGLLGPADQNHVYASQELPKKHPEVVTWLENFHMTTDELISLEHKVFVEYADEQALVGVAAWVAENREWVDGLTQ
jgi:glycine betaine/proline transport system substrate-binding protein